MVQSALGAPCSSTLSSPTAETVNLSTMASIVNHKLTVCDAIGGNVATYAEVNFITTDPSDWYTALTFDSSKYQAGILAKFTYYTPSGQTVPPFNNDASSTTLSGSMTKLMVQKMLITYPATASVPAASTIETIKLADLPDCTVNTEVFENSGNINSIVYDQ